MRRYRRIAYRINNKIRIIQIARYTPQIRISCEICVRDTFEIYKECRITTDSMRFTLCNVPNTSAAFNLSHYFIIKFYGN